MKIKTPALMTPKLAAWIIASTLLTACGSAGEFNPLNAPQTPNTNNPQTPTDPGTPSQPTDPVDPVEPAPPATRAPKTFEIADTNNPAADQAVALTAFFVALPGDTIEFLEGTFDLDTTLVMGHSENITIKGQGMDKTILNFETSNSSEGISMSHMDGIVIEDLTILDTPGFSIKVSDSDHVVMRNVRAMWSDFNGNMDPDTPSTLDVECVGTDATSTGTFTDANGQPQTYNVDVSNGGYAIYPVLSNNVLLDNVVAYGASDAGIYVGQSNNVIVKNSHALFNVAGFEIENTDNADVFDNLADCNTGGFLIFDLPGLNQYGDKTRMFNNVSEYNNTANFAPPNGVVAAVPRGTGMLSLGYDEQEIYNNTIRGNSTAGFIFVSLELIEEGLDDFRMDLYPEAVNLHDNAFINNGQQPQPPSQDALICDETIQDLTGECVPTGVNQKHASLLPALVQIKNARGGFPGVGAHIVWDGFQDDGFSKDDDGNVCELDPKFESLKDANGKPQYTGEHFPECRNNTYKFEEVTATSSASLAEQNEFTADRDNNPSTPDITYRRKHPQYWNCFKNNTFSSIGNVPEYLNFVDTEPTTPGKYDASIHDCEARYGNTLASLPAAVVEEYVPPANGSTVPSDEEILAICENYSGNTINRAALQFNCPKLEHYNLFSDKTDPRVGFNEGGILYELTTPLFSDYASKYRIVWAPPGEKIGWRQGSSSAPQETLFFPLGSIIAKTFTFKNGNNEEVVETRLLIHRESSKGTFWEGLPYEWNADMSEATLAVAGATRSVSWDYTDEDPRIGTQYTGSTPNYSIPHPNQCGECHANDDRPAGDAPIGPKVRLLNMAINVNGSLKNQLQHWIDSGILEAPSGGLTINSDQIATNAHRLPTFNLPANVVDFVNIPGSSYQENADGDNIGGVWAMDHPNYQKEMKARAYLETNCAHCHNRKGIAKQTGLWVDIYRRVGTQWGVCKTAVTSGSASDGRQFLFQPTVSDNSIISYRIGTSLAGQRMPPVARSVNHGEAVAIINDWVNNVMNDEYPNSSCAP